MFSDYICPEIRFSLGECKYRDIDSEKRPLLSILVEECRHEKRELTSLQAMKGLPICHISQYVKRTHLIPFCHIDAIRLKWRFLTNDLYESIDDSADN